MQNNLKFEFEEEYRNDWPEKFIEPGNDSDISDIVGYICWLEGKLKLAKFEIDELNFEIEDLKKMI